MIRSPATRSACVPAYKSVLERIEARIADLDPSLSPARKVRRSRNEAEEAVSVGSVSAVAGFDFTFSIPKSASALGAVADAGTQALIGEAHHAAVAEVVVAFMEREVAATRSGNRRRRCRCAGRCHRVGGDGVRSLRLPRRRPHLHTHVVISNKVQTAFDGNGAVWTGDRCTPPWSPCRSCTRRCSPTT